MNHQFTIVIAENDELIRNLYELMLPIDFECRLIVFDNGFDACEYVKNHDDCHLIISDNDMPKMSGIDFYLQAGKDKKIPFILITGDYLLDLPRVKDVEFNQTERQYIIKPFDRTHLKNAVLKSYLPYLEYQRKQALSDGVESTKSKLLSQNFDFQLDQTHGKLSKIPIHLLKRYGHESTDVFVLIHQDKFTKILAKENSFNLDTAALDGYMKKNVSYAYVPYDYFTTLSKHMINQLINKAKQLKKVTPVELAGLQLNISLSGLLDLGISTEHIESVNHIIEETIQTIFSDKIIDHKMKEIMKNFGYQTSHSVLLMYVASMILKKTNLPFHLTLKKISMAAFFHDMTLPEEICNKELYETHPDQEVAIVDKNILLNHPRMNAEMLDKMQDDLFNDVRKIILEHHELPNGKGYPKKLDSKQISSLSALFIISHHIADCLYRNDYNKESLNQYLINIEPDFHSGNFRLFFEHAKTLFCFK